MIKLFDAATSTLLGDLTEAQLNFLIDHLEEESETDQDYYINAETIDSFEESGADPALVALLRSALGSRTEMDVRWEE